MVGAPATPACVGLPRRQPGFSLLELLLTLVIVGLIVSLAGLGISSGSQPYRIDAAIKQFADVAEYALDEAQLNGIDMGLLIEEDSDRHGVVYSYQWLQRDITGWELARFDADAYGRRQLPRDIELLLEVEQGNALRPTEERPIRVLNKAALNL